MLDVFVADQLRALPWEKTILQGSRLVGLPTYAPLSE